MRYLTSIEESIKDILLTPLGSRVMLPNYGSRLFELIDRRIDDDFRSDLAYFVIEAVEKWEKRVKIKRVKLNSLNNAKLSFSVHLKSGESLEIDYVRS